MKFGALQERAGELYSKSKTRKEFQCEAQTSNRPQRGVGDEDVATDDCENALFSTPSATTPPKHKLGDPKRPPPLNVVVTQISR